MRPSLYIARYPRSRRPALIALVSLALSLLLARARAGVTIEDTNGVYRKQVVEPDCPESITIGTMIGTQAKITSSSSKCDSGKIDMTEGPGAKDGDSYTTVLVRGPKYVGTIVLANVSTPVTCDPDTLDEQIKQGTIINFLRPRMATLIKFRNEMMRFKTGFYYLVLESRCIYVKDSVALTDPVSTPKAAAQGSNASGATKNKGRVQISPWAWAGPIIGVGVLALAGMLWCAVGRNKDSSGGGYIVEENSVSDESGIGTFYGEDPQQGEGYDDDDELRSNSPRLRYSTDVQYFGPDPGQERRVSLGGPPTESESDASSSVGGPYEP